MSALSTHSLRVAYGWDETPKTLQLLEAIRQNFIDFTERHVVRVNTLASFIGNYYPEHDQDKYTLPFYYLLQWQHSGYELARLPDSEERLNEEIGKNTWAHILRNSHHPEHWDSTLSLNIPFDRDNPRMGIDARSMTMEALHEYVCDCMSMSIMIQKDPTAVYKWFSDNIDVKKGKRWLMTGAQIKYINSLAEYIIIKLKNPKRRVYFDVDGVLRDIVKYFGTSGNSWDEMVNGMTIYEAITKDFSCLDKMEDMQFVPTVQKFSKSPHILTCQLEPEAKMYTAMWLSRRFALPQVKFVNSSAEKATLLNPDDRIFDDHPKFPESNKLIIVGHLYNNSKPGFRINTIAELEGALDVLQPWS